MIQLPEIFSDGMVIQKNGRIWGKCEKGERVAVTFLGKTYETAGDEYGKWEIALQADEFGGEHILKVGNKVIKDVTIGYVFFCGGQSNMELPVSRIKHKFASDFENVNYPFIRAFTVKKAYDFAGEHADCEGDWQKATNEKIDGFFAAAYFFALDLWQKYKVPIGLIACAAGGSSAESWISEGSLTPFPRICAALNECKNTDIKETEKADMQNVRLWYDSLDKADTIKNEDVTTENYDDSHWNERNLTDSFEKDLNFNGSVWFRKTVEIPLSMTGKPAVLNLGRVVDSNYVYVNGRFAGRIEYQYPPSTFTLPPDMLKFGKNLIVVRIISSNGIGGFVKDKPYKITANNEEINLDGKWKYKVGAVMPPMPKSQFFCKEPSGLYNAMLSPVIGYSISAVIFYQGESNTAYPDEYKALMETLIGEWRRKWKHNFPFIFTQLANFEANSGENWARLRNHQLLCLDIPSTAMAVTIDCGEYNDLHPLDKKTVGQRLSLAARKLVFNEDIVYSGPVPLCARLENEKIAVSFSHTGSGLKISGNKLNCFEIETDIGIHKADAVLDKNGNKVIITNSVSDENPLFVRYAYCDSPGSPNLYNQENLPASPFRIKIV